MYLNNILYIIHRSPFRNFFVYLLNLTFTKFAVNYRYSMKLRLLFMFYISLSIPEDLQFTNVTLKCNRVVLLILCEFNIFVKWNSCR